MEAFGIAPAGESVQQNGAETLRRGGVPDKAAAAWSKAQPPVSGNLKRDVAAATKFWRAGNDLLAKLPKKL